MTRMEAQTRTVWGAALLVLGAYVLHDAMSKTTHGFIAYYAASRLLVSGHLGPWVYDDVWFNRYVQDLTGTGVLEIFGPNTPTMALLALPFVFLGSSAARNLWLVTSLLGLAAASAALLRDAARRDERVPAVFVAVMLLSPVVFANLRTAQAYLFVFTAFAAAALCLLRQRDVLAGVLLGVIFVLKSSGWPLLVLLGAHRRARSVKAAALVCGAAVLLLLLWAGGEIWLRYPTYVWDFVQRPYVSVTAYQTTWGFVRHLCVSDLEWNPVAAANCGPVATWLPGFLIASAILITITASFRCRTALWVAAGICLSVLAVPIAEEHQFAALGIPMMFTLQARARRARTGVASSWWPWIVFVALFVVPLEYTAYRFTTGWSALAAYPRLYGAWWLWGLSVREMVHDRRSAASPS